MTSAVIPHYQLPDLNAGCALVWPVWLVCWLLVCFEVSLRCECLDEGGLADAVVAAHKHFGHVQRHSARVKQAQQVALLLVNTVGSGGEAVNAVCFTSVPSNIQSRRNTFGHSQ